MAVIVGALLVYVSKWPVSWLLKEVSEASESHRPVGLSERQWILLTEDIPGGEWIGLIERFFFFVAFSIRSPELVAGWLMFKAACKRDVWRNISHLPKRLPRITDFNCYMDRTRYGAETYRRWGCLRTFLLAWPVLVSYVVLPSLLSTYLRSGAGVGSSDL